MTVRKAILATLLLFAVLGVVAWQIFRPREPDPIYEGERLSYWLQLYNRYSPPAFPEWKKPDAAVRHAGTNAIPLLLRLMRAYDPPIKRKLARWSDQNSFMASHPGLALHFEPASTWNMQAERGFAALGAEGENAVPELIWIYNLNPSQFSQDAVILAFGFIGPGAKESVPLLVRAATNSDVILSSHAIFALGRIHAQPEVVVPILRKALNDPAPYLPFSAAVALGEFGPQAESAFPRLLELRETAQPQSISSKGADTKKWVEDALKKIDPTAAANAGIK